MKVQTAGNSPKDFESITVSTTAIGLTTAKAEAANEAYISLEDSAVRFRLDGVAPTASEGHKLNAGMDFKLNGQGQMAGFKAIAISGSGVLKVTYSK